MKYVEFAGLWIVAACLAAVGWSLLVDDRWTPHPGRRAAAGFGFILAGLAVFGWGLGGLTI